MGEIDDLIGKVAPRYSKGPIWENKIVYDTNISTLEPLYFWIIDFLAGYKPEKLVDNFTAAPGSSYFADLGARATKMQEEAMKILGAVNLVVKSVINLVYDLKNFEQRLAEYDAAKSKKASERERGVLALKEIWMNSVDAQRGMGSINNMAQQYGFTLLRPAFMAVMPDKDAPLDSMNDVVDTMQKKLELNDIVLRVLKPRISEFVKWVELSEKELRNRYKIQQSYLRNQVDTLKLYSSWVKPYINAAEQLRMKENKEPALVSVFGSMILELTLLAKNQVDVAGEVESGNLPPAFAKKKDKIRDFWQVILVDFKFRTYPTQQAPHAGRVDIKFSAYALNNDEMLLFEKLREEAAVDSVLGVAERASGESLKVLQEDINRFLELNIEKKEEKEKKEKLLLTELYDDIKKYFVSPSKSEKEREEKEKKAKEKKEKEERKKKLKEEGVADDNYEESVVREFTELNAAEFCFKTFDVFKKSQGMASFPSPFDEPEFIQRLREKKAEARLLLKKANK